MSTDASHYATGAKLWHPTEDDWDALGLGTWWRRHRRFSVEAVTFIENYHASGRVTLESFQRFCRAVVNHSFGEGGRGAGGLGPDTESILLLGQHHAMMADPKCPDSEKVEYARDLLARMRAEEGKL